MRILVTGATGYIGGRLAPLLADAGHDVLCLSRDPSKLDQVPWRHLVEVRRGDVSALDALRSALEGVDVVFYLVHSMMSGPTFAHTDRQAAQTMRTALEGSTVKRLVYLGGLGPKEGLSEHLASRREVGEILAGSSVPTTLLRAGVVLGSGSASFEMLRNLTERLPVMVTPRWVYTRTQPIALRDVLHYLQRAGEDTSGDSLVLDVGGPDVLTYEEMMQTYASVAGLRPRRILPVPFFSPRLSSHWVGVVTPVPAQIARPLVGSLRVEVVCASPTAMERYGEPDGGLDPFQGALERILEEVRSRDVPTRWSDSSWHGAPHQRLPQDPEWAGGVFTDVRMQHSLLPPAEVWPVVEAIGGRTGWYSWRSAWAARGLFDLLLGAATPLRGRRDPVSLRVGDAVDAWRVEKLERPYCLRLRSEMRLPGIGWLEWTLEEHDGTLLTQRATFAPKGLLGVLYWKSISPLHTLVFGSMVKGIVRAAMHREPSPADWEH